MAAQGSAGRLQAQAPGRKMNSIKAEIQNLLINDILFLLSIQINFVGLI
jgi:hypothetical protein